MKLPLVLVFIAVAAGAPFLGNAQAPHRPSGPTTASGGKSPEQHPPLRDAAGGNDAAKERERAGEGNSSGTISADYNAVIARWTVVLGVVGIAGAVISAFLFVATWRAANAAKDAAIAAEDAA